MKSSRHLEISRKGLRIKDAFLKYRLPPIIFSTRVKNEERYLKSDSHLPKKNCIICFTEGLLKMMKSACYFSLKAPFLLKIF